MPIKNIMMIGTYSKAAVLAVVIHLNAYNMAKTVAMRPPEPTIIARV